MQPPTPRPLPTGTTLLSSVKRRVLGWLDECANGTGKGGPDAGVKAMLAADALTEDARWHDFGIDQAVVRFEISERLWDDLLTDTAETLLQLG